jgi:NTF2-like N-terminal transpeptidase domain
MATSASRVASLLTIAMVIVSLNACTPRPNGPEPAAEEFFAALATGDTDAAAELSDRPADARAALNEAWAGLQAMRLDAQILGSKWAEDTGAITYRYTWHLPKNRAWTYDGQLNMVRDEGRWEVRWSATGLHPKLGEHQTFALRSDPPRRASVNERGGTDVLAPGHLYH